MVVGDRLLASVIAVGQIGVWRVVHSDTYSSNEVVCRVLADETEPFQPEHHDFIVLEILTGILLTCGVYT